MKKLLFVIVMVLLVGCAENTNMQVDVEVDKKISIKGEETQVEVSDKGLDLPVWYPEEKFPLYKDFILVSSNLSDGNMMILGTSQTDLNIISDYYKDFLKSSGQLENSTKDSYLQMGHINGLDYNLTLTMTDDKQTAFSIILVKNDQAPVSGSSAGGHMSLPSDYPEDILPFYDGDYQTINILNGTSEKMIIMSVDEEVENLVTYYEDLLVGSKSYMSMPLDDGHMILGIKEGYNISILVSQHFGDHDHASEVQIIYIKE